MTSTSPSDPEPRFTSPREKRLWTFVAVAVGGIYSTLFLSGVLSRFFYSQGLAAVVFLVCMALVAASLMSQGLRVRPKGIEIGILLGLVAVYAMLALRLTAPERSHLFEYGVVAGLIYEAVAERRAGGRATWPPWICAVLFATAVGTVDELAQTLLPWRHYDPVDILFNFMASAGAATTMSILSWIRRRFAARASANA